MKLGVTMNGSQHEMSTERSDYISDTQIDMCRNDRSTIGQELWDQKTAR